MALNPREKMIAMVVGGVIAAAGLYYAFDTFYWNPLQTIKSSLAKGQTKLNQDSKELANTKATADKEWEKLKLQTATDAAADQVIRYVLQMGQRTGFPISNFVATSAGRTASSKSEFEELKFQATGTGTVYRVASFLHALEKAEFPLRINDVTLNARAEGLDNLTVEVAISALVHSPKTTTRPGTTMRGTTQTARGGTTRGGVARGGTGRGQTGTGGTVAATAPAAAAGEESFEAMVARLRARREAELAEPAGGSPFSPPGSPFSATAPAINPATGPATTGPATSIPAISPPPTGGVQ